jgi:hypothetical protein
MGKLALGVQSDFEAVTAVRSALSLRRNVNEHHPRDYLAH